MKILLVSAMDTSSGYGSDGCGLAMALEDIGHTVRLAPIHVTVPLPQQVAMQMTAALDPPFDAAIVHVDPLHLICEEALRRVSERVVAWTMWEWESFSPRGWSKLRRIMGKQKWHRSVPPQKGFDALISYDPVTQTALKPHVPSYIQHYLLQGGYWADGWPYIGSRDWSGTMRFIMVGQLHRRKDPFAAIKAFAKVKEEHGDEFDAELHLKTMIKAFHPKMEEVYPWLRIHYEWWTTERLFDFYGESHVLLAPSLGEGKNLPALEAQSTGMAVAATRFGGHAVWMHPELNYEIPSQPWLDKGMGMCVKADVDAFADLIWHIYTHRDEARHKGEAASKAIPAMCDWHVVGRKVIDILNQMPRADLAVALG